MSTFGRQVLSKTGRDVMVLADLQDAQFKVGGITIDWSLFAAAGSDATLPDQTPIKTGDKYIRFGQVLCRVSQSEVQTIDLSPGSDPTGGTWDITSILGNAIDDIPFDVSATALQALINALATPGADQITVSKSGFVYTVNFPASLGNVDAITADGSNMTTATAITISTTTAGLSSSDKYGPYDPSASDGRQNLNRGDCWVANRTVLQNSIIPSLNNEVTDHPQVFDGGTAWKQRILMTTGTHSLAAGPTVTEFQTAFPRVAYAGV